MDLRIDKLSSGGIMTNYECSVRCTHCRHKASPNRKSGFITEEQLDKTIKKLEALNCESVHLEGGEPFLFPDELLRAVKQLNLSKVNLEHIVTNCSWYKNQKDTIALFKELRSNGVHRLLLKVGPFQNESIPLKKVQNVAAAAEKVGINVMIWDSEFYPDVASFEPSKTHSLKKYIKKFGDDYIRKIASHYNVTFAGRSFEAYKNYFHKHSVASLLSSNKSCKHDFPTHTHFHFDLFGNFSFSHTQGVTVELEDLGKSLDKDKYPFLDILFNEGINGIYKLATTKYGFVPEKEYLSKCHLCYETRRYLVTQKGINSPDLQPLDFYFES